MNRGCAYTFVTLSLMVKRGTLSKVEGDKLWQRLCELLKDPICLKLFELACSTGQVIGKHPQSLAQYEKILTQWSTQPKTTPTTQPPNGGPV